MKQLVVTADDFGIAPAVNAAVIEAHTHGILTATSLMIGAPAAADAVALAHAHPGLGVGLHLVLVDGVPVLPADAVPDLVDAHGRFRDDMVRAGLAFVLSGRVRSQLEAEIAAQFTAFAATGLRLDHVNAHKHFHLHPTIAGLVLDIGRRFAMRAVRAPVEPGFGGIAAPWAKLLRARLRRAGMAVPDQVYGLRDSGAMTAERLRAIVAALPAGLSEIYLHPATRDDYPGHAPGYRYRDELAALIDPAVALASAPLARGSFEALCAR